MGRNRKKHNHSANLGLILNELRKSSPEGGMTLKELADLCGVSKRNVYRYLNEIEDMGFELIRPTQTRPCQPGHGKYRLSGKALLENKTDTNLMMILGFFAQGQLQYHEHLKVVKEFFIRYLAAKYKLSLPVNWVPSSTASNAAPDEQKKETQSNVRNLPLSGQKQCEIVKIVISPAAAEKIAEEQLNYSIIKQEYLSDGSLLLTLEVNEFDNILSWIFKWGEDAEIVEPHWLRKRMINTCKAITKAYNSKFLSKKITYLQTIEIS